MQKVTYLRMCDRKKRGDINMILEYLFFDNTNRANVEIYNEKFIENHKTNKKNTLIPKITYKNLKETDYFIVKYELSGDNEQIANIMSDLNEKICKEFSPTVLTNESSEFYNKKLYPLINKFERSLRKLLYLKVTLCKEEKLKNAILNIDQKDFGDMYNILFVDDKFYTNVKEKIKKIKIKSELLESINGLQEQTAWDILIGDSFLDIIKDNFVILKDYRNDVMHAHNINHSRFKEAKELFSEANEKLENHIGTTLQQFYANAILPTTLDVLYEKLMAFSNDYEKIENNLSYVIDIIKKLPKLSPETTDTLKNFSTIINALLKSEKNELSSQNDGSNTLKKSNNDDSNDNKCKDENSSKNNNDNSKDNDSNSEDNDSSDMK